MSTTNPLPDAARDAADFDEIADKLFQLRPDLFARARDEAIGRAKSEGRKVLARELGGLHRPTQSAWLVNLLGRDQRATIEGLLQLAVGLSEAQTQSTGRELLRLTEARRELEGALLRRAGKLAEAAGVKITPTMEREVQGTLSAALADPAAAAELRKGRLEKPLAYAGFGSFPMSAAVPETSASSIAAPEIAAASSAPSAAEPPRVSSRAREEAARQAEAAERLRQEAEHAEHEARRRQEREAAERSVAEARAAADAAARLLGARTHAASALDGAYRASRETVNELRLRLRALEAEVAEAERAADAASRLLDEARRESEAAARAVEDAENALKKLE